MFFVDKDNFAVRGSVLNFGGGGDFCLIRGYIGRGCFWVKFGIGRSRICRDGEESIFLAVGSSMSKGFEVSIGYVWGEVRNFLSLGFWLYLKGRGF